MNMTYLFFEQFKCQCEADYIGRATKPLEKGIALPNMYHRVLEKIHWKICISIPLHSNFQSQNILKIGWGDVHHSPVIIFHLSLKSPPPPRDNLY